MSLNSYPNKKNKTIWLSCILSRGKQKPLESASSLPCISGLGYHESFQGGYCPPLTVKNVLNYYLSMNN